MKQLRPGLQILRKNTSEQFVFCGFNAFTPVEEKLRSLNGIKRSAFSGRPYYFYDESRKQENSSGIIKHGKNLMITELFSG
jgi:hypothetical protein